MAHATVDMVVDFLDDLGSLPAQRRATAEEMEARLPGAAPAAPVPYERILEDLGDTSSPSPASTDTLASSPSSPAAAPFPACSATSSPARSTSRSARGWRRRGPRGWRLIVLDWFKEWIGYPPGAAGVLVSGGSAANLTALACAREAIVGAMRDDLVIYACDQAHSSVARAARALGFRPDPGAGAAQRRGLPPAPRRPPRRDRRRPRRRPRPPSPSAPAPARPTPARSTRCPSWPRSASRSGLWLHVDGAYGGFAALTERGARRLAGIERADSVTLDPHKWLYQPFECGCLLVREGRLLDDAFRVSPHYLKDTEASRRRGGLRRPRPSALADGARAQGLDVGAAPSASTPSAAPSIAPSTSPRSPSAGSRRARSWSC